MTNFCGIYPKEMFCIPKSPCKTKETSLRHILKIGHGITISVEIFICLLSCFSHSYLTESCNPQGCDDRSNDWKWQAIGRKATHLRSSEPWKPW